MCLRRRDYTIVETSALITCSGGECHVVGILKQPYGKFLPGRNRLPANSQRELAVCINAPSWKPLKPSDDCSLGQYLDYNLRRDLEPEPLSLDAAKFLTDGNRVQ